MRCREGAYCDISEEVLTQIIVLITFIPGGALSLDRLNPTAMAALRGLSLKVVKGVNVKFDPFHPKAVAAR